MHRHTRSEKDHKFHIHGRSYKHLTGSRAQVMNQSAYKTPGGLLKHELMMNKWGRIVSRLKHKTAKRERRLEKAGFFAKKGEFGVVKKEVKTAKRRRSSKKR